MQATLPHMVSMHPMAPDHIHEELELENSDFSSYQLEWVARCPRWRGLLPRPRPDAAYQWLLNNLKILQWRQPRERWVLKSPQHLEQLGPLLATFPDATIVMTHRTGVGRPVRGHHDDLRGTPQLPHPEARFLYRLLAGPDPAAPGDVRADRACCRSTELATCCSTSSRPMTLLPSSAYTRLPICP